jgi:hypothetical protein
VSLAAQKAADEFAAKMLPIIDAIRARGITTLAGIAAHAAEMVDGPRCRELVDDCGFEHSEAGTA